MRALAQHLQDQGRGKDTVLVHMSPREVGGLQALAKAAGGSLTTNPTTGLPEASFLEDLLPTLAGVAGGAMGVDPWIAGLGGLAAQTAITGDLSKGLMAGLGAYGGASIGYGLLGGANRDTLGLNSNYTKADVNMSNGEVGAAPTAGGITQSADGRDYAAVGQAPTAVSEPPNIVHNTAGIDPSKGSWGNFTAAASAGTPFQNTIGSFAKYAPYAAALGVASPLLGSMGPQTAPYNPASASAADPVYKGPYTPVPRKVIRNPFAASDSSEHMYFDNPNPYGVVPHAAAGGLVALAGGGITTDAAPDLYDPAGRGKLYGGGQQKTGRDYLALIGAPPPPPPSAPVRDFTFHPQASGAGEKNYGIVAPKGVDLGGTSSSGSYPDPATIQGTSTASPNLSNVSNGFGGPESGPYGSGWGDPNGYGAGIADISGGAGLGGYGGLPSLASAPYGSYGGDTSGLGSLVSDAMTRLGNQTLDPSKYSAGQWGNILHTILGFTPYGIFDSALNFGLGATDNMSPEGSGTGLEKYVTGRPFMQSLGNAIFNGGPLTLPFGLGTIGGDSTTASSTPAPAPYPGSDLNGTSQGDLSWIPQSNSPYGMENSATPNSAQSWATNLVADTSAMSPQGFLNFGMGRLGTGDMGGGGGGWGGGGVGGGWNEFTGTGGRTDKIGTSTSEARGGSIRYAQGGPVQLGNGSFVMDARTVSELGNGSSSAGQELLARLGGQPIHGPGDGVSDSVHASIGGNQEARVARDEVQFSPEAVTRLGGGDPQKGSKYLYSLMAKARQARIHAAKKDGGRGVDTGLRALVGA